MKTNKKLIKNPQKLLEKKILLYILEFPSYTTLYKRLYK